MVAKLELIDHSNLEMVTKLELIARMVTLEELIARKGPNGVDGAFRGIDCGRMV